MTKEARILEIRIGELQAGVPSFELGIRNSGRGIPEEPLGYAALCAFDQVFPPHPDPLPQREGTAGD